MPHRTTATNSPKRQAQHRRSATAAGPHGIALAPPAYGLDVVDQATGAGPLQRMPGTDLTRGTIQAPVQRQAPVTPPNYTDLPDILKVGIESLSDYDMSDVKVHYNSSRPAQFHALAYTQNTDIHVAPGQTNHLAHEAWHVVQQKQGRAKPTLQARDVMLNDDEGLEHEAEMPL